MQFSRPQSTTPMSAGLQIEPHSENEAYSLICQCLSWLRPILDLPVHQPIFKVSGGYFKVTVAFAYFEAYTLLLLHKQLGLSLSPYHLIIFN